LQESASAANKGLDGAEECDDNMTSQSSEGTMLELLRYPNMRRKFFILTFLWLANSVAYNGLSYNSSNLGVSGKVVYNSIITTLDHDTILDFASYCYIRYACLLYQCNCRGTCIFIDLVGHGINIMLSTKH